MDSLIDNVNHQIRANMLDMTTGIVRLEQAMSRGTAEDSKQMHLVLPRFLDYIFGKGTELGWFELFQNETDFQSLYNFLKPEGSLVSFLLLFSSELTLTYELEEKDFIPKAQKILETKGNVNFEVEQVYTGRLFNLGGRYMLKLNMFEYYIFHFTLCPLNNPRISRSLSKMGSKTRRLDLIWEDLFINQGKFVSLLSKYFWSTDESAELYLMLLRQYLEFCLPTRASGPGLNLTNLRCIPHISFAVKMSEFCIGLFLEYWLNNCIQDDKTQDVKTGNTAITLDLVKGVENVLAHLRNFNKELRVGVSSKLNRNSQFDQTGLKLVDKGIFLSYRFLKSQLLSWPQDASIAALISLWKVFLGCFEFPFLGLQVLGKKLLNHITISLDQLINIPLAQIDWNLMGIQVSLLLQCLDGILGKLIDNLSWIQSWEEELPEEAKSQIQSFEEESFKLESFLLGEEKLPFKLGEILSSLYSLVYNVDIELRQRVEISSKLLSKCFLINVDLRERPLKDSIQSNPTLKNRFNLKRSLIQQSTSPYNTVKSTSLLHVLFTRFKPFVISIIIAFIFIWMLFFSPS
jgi:hypothetical protein